MKELNKNELHKEALNNWRTKIKVNNNVIYTGKGKNVLNKEINEIMERNM